MKDAASKREINCKPCDRPGQAWVIRFNEERSGEQERPNENGKTSYRLRHAERPIA